MTRKVLIFTGNRAEYGLLYPLILELNKSSEIDCSLLVSGAHMEKDHGSTLSEIINDGFKISDTVDLPNDKSTNFSITNAIGVAIQGIAQCLNELKPDIFVVYADRYEGFAAVVASTQMAIATCHIEGGDITEGGALDDNLRHAMTKLSHIHCATNDLSKDRILALGEENWRVHNIGYPTIDLIKQKNYSSEIDLLKEFNFNKKLPIVLFTQHSIATEVNETKTQISQSIEALCSIAKRGYQVICTYPNNDAGGKEIIKLLEKIDIKEYDFFKIIPSLGRKKYHGVMALNLDGYKVVCAGNTSSGLKETAAFKCPTVNIGSRQKGRLHASNIVHVNYNTNEILNGFKVCVENNEFTKNLNFLENPYGKGGSGKKFCKIIKNVKLNKELIQKKLSLPKI
jgi:UDP-hydrolysing UDP-N-acetyl-D-glucosamine 2-epimerase